MREKVFRGYDPINKVWRLGGYARKNIPPNPFDDEKEGPLTTEYIVEEISFVHGPTKALHMFPVEQKSIGEYVGRRDGVSRRIFEGDKVRVHLGIDGIGMWEHTEDVIASFDDPRTIQLIMEADALFILENTYIPKKIAS